MRIKSRPQLSGITQPKEILKLRKYLDAKRTLTSYFKLDSDKAAEIIKIFDEYLATFPEWDIPQYRKRGSGGFIVLAVENTNGHEGVYRYYTGRNYTFGGMLLAETSGNPCDAAVYATVEEAKLVAAKTASTFPNISGATVRRAA